MLFLHSDVGILTQDENILKRPFRAPQKCYKGFKIEAGLCREEVERTHKKESLLLQICNNDKLYCLTKTRSLLLMRNVTV